METDISDGKEDLTLLGSNAILESWRGRERRK